MLLPNIHVFQLKVFVFVFTAAASQVEEKSITARCTMDQLLFIKSSCCSFRCNAPDGHTGGHHRKILKCVVMEFCAIKSTKYWMSQMVTLLVISAKMFVAFLWHQFQHFELIRHPTFGLFLNKIYKIFKCSLLSSVVGWWAQFSFVAWHCARQGVPFGNKKKVF